MYRRVLIIANPISGGGRSRRAAHALAEALHARGIDGELAFTTRAGDARRFAAELDRAHFDAVVSVGGDGTLNEVVNGLVDPATPLAMLPMGTANVLACDLRLPRKVPAVADALQGGATRPHAIGTAGGRRFLLFVGAGLDGAMVQRLEEMRRGTLGKSGWVKPVLQVVRELPQHLLSVETEDGALHEDLSQVMVTRVRNYGGGFRLPRGIDAGEGVLHVLCFRQRSRIAWFGTALRAWLLGMKAGRDCEVMVARSVKIRAADPVPFQLDGDLGGTTPLEVHLDGATAQVIVPRL